MNQRLIQDEGHRNPMSLAELERRLGQWLAGDYRAVIFEEDGRARGYALFREEPGYFYLRQLFIAAEYRRQGIGRRAIAWLSEHLWRGGRVRVEVLTGNAAGTAFWRAVGFGEYSLTMERAGEGEALSGL